MTRRALKGVNHYHHEEFINPFTGELRRKITTGCTFDSQALKK